MLARQNKKKSAKKWENQKPWSVLSFRVNLIWLKIDTEPAYSFVSKQKCFVSLCKSVSCSHPTDVYRKSMHLPSYSCPLCNTGTIKSILHLFWDYPFSMGYWGSINLTKTRGTSFPEECELAFVSLPRQIALNIIIMGCWNIWKQRNELIFNSARPSIGSWKQRLKNDLTIVGYRIKTKHEPILKEWIDLNLP